MKPFKILMLLITIPCLLFAQDGELKSWPFIAQKINYNYKNCTLTVKASKWIKDGKKDLLPIVVTLSNNSDDTLKYGSELCFQGIFMGGVNNKNLEVDGIPNECLKNWPIVEVILPHSSVVYSTSLSKKGVVGDYPEKFRLYFYLTIVPGENDVMSKFFITDKKLIKKYNRDIKKRTHLIWSNEVEI